MSLRTRGTYLCFERLLALTHLLRAGEPVNVPLLAARFGVSVRTAQRDLDFLRDRCGFDLRYDARARRFRTRRIGRPLAAVWPG